MKLKHDKVQEAKARPAAAFCLFGTEALLQHLHKLPQEIEGVHRNDDIECVHRMRVASRRLRNLLPLFAACLPPKQTRRWNRQLRRLGRVLGTARDTDVQIVYVQRFLADCKQEHLHPGVTRLLLRLQQHRQRLQTSILKVLQRLESKHFFSTMVQTLKHLREGYDTSEGSESCHYTYHQAHTAILDRLETLHARASQVQGPDSNSALHDMRIAVKRLRYTMQAFAALYHDALKLPLRLARDLQDVLGAIHDYDVWLDSFPRFLEEERARTLMYFGHTDAFADLVPGLQSLQDHCRHSRAEAYHRFETLWSEANAQGIWNTLLQVVAFPRALSSMPSEHNHAAMAGAVAPDQQAMVEALQPLEPRLRASPSSWQWHVATLIPRIPPGHLITCGGLAAWANTLHASRLNAANVAWLRLHLFTLLGPDTPVPLYRTAKAGDVHSQRDPDDLKAYNDKYRAAEGMLTQSVWWRP